MSNNTHGNINEHDLVTALNGKTFSELNTNLKSFIKSLDHSITNNTIIYSERLGGNRKADLSISINNKTFNISVKMGSGNSVHQEKIEDFINFLKREYSISNSIANDLRFFIWGDNTLDGTGNLEDRINATNMKKLYPDKINNIKRELSKHKEDLLNRFIFTGRYNDSIDYIYHGTLDNGLWASKNELWPYIINESKKDSISVGVLTFQAWNRSISGNSDNKRGQIQLKCGQLGNILKQIKMERIYD